MNQRHIMLIAAKYTIIVSSTDAAEGLRDKECPKVTIIKSAKYTMKRVVGNEIVLNNNGNQ